MKVNKWYLLFIILLLGVIWALEYNMPRKFVWTPTFSRYDKQPFGSAIFDDIVSASLPDGYEVVNKTFYQLEQDSLNNTAILLVDDRLYLNRVDAESVLNIVSRGNKVMLVTSSLGHALPDTLKLNVSTDYFRIGTLRNYVSNGYDRDTICWKKDALYGEAHFYAYPHLFRSYFTKHDSLATVLAVRNIENEESPVPVALKYTWGSGELYLVSTPLLFSNYGMLDENNSAYIFRLLTQMKGMPLLRTEGYGKVQEEPQTPLRYFLSQSPLRWGIYLTFILLLLFMVFTAKRRQRVIPVMKGPENKSLEFVKLIGTLYFQKKDHADLVRKKQIYFADLLRRSIQVDMHGSEDDRRNARRITAKTGIDEEEIYQLLTSLRKITSNENIRLSETEMRMYIDKMNQVIDQL